jgi:hypothetical protein
VNFRMMRASVLVASAAALVFAATACTSAPNPTLIYIYTTATPRPTGTPTPIATPTPTPTPTPVPTDTPVAGSPVPGSAAPSSAPSATPTAAPATSAGPAGACSGASKPDNAAFWASTANHEPFTVYCGVVPGPDAFLTANSTWGSTGLVTASYKTTGGGRIDVSEGTFTAAAHTGSLGSAKFGDLSGSLYSTSSGFVINVAGTHAYQATGTGMSQATFVSIVAAMLKVAKS